MPLTDAATHVVPDHPGGEAHASLTTIINRGRLIAMWVVSVMVFVPTIYAFAQHGSQVSWPDWLALLAALALLAVAVVGRGYARRAGWFFASSFLLLVAPLVPLPYTGAWVPVLNIGVAICGGAALALRPWPAVAVILAASILMTVSAPYSPPSVPLGGMPFAVPVSLAVLCGIGFVLFTAAIARTAGWLDEQARLLQEAEAHELSKIAESRHRAAVDRRIHETVLNTLQAVALGVQAKHALDARVMCERDLESLTRGPLTVPATHADALVASVVGELSTPAFVVTNDIAATALLEAFEATALRDALVEALRNCMRHSQSDRAHVRTFDDGSAVVVEVIDLGVGFEERGNPSFGIQRSMVRGLSGVGGDAEVTPLTGGGTVVTLRVPHSTPPEERSLDWPFARMATESGWARFGLVLVPCLLFPWSSWIGDALGNELAIRLLCLVFVALVFGAAALWDGPLRIPLAVGALAASGVLLVLAAVSGPDCSAEYPVQALIAAATGTGLFLPIVALPGTLPRSIAVAAILGLSALVVESLPGECQGSLRSVIDATTYLSAWVLVLALLERLGASRHAEAERAWKRILADQAVVAEEQARLAGWTRIDADTRELFASLASGRLAFDDNTVRERAAEASARTRERLMGDVDVPIPASVAAVLAVFDTQPRVRVHGTGETEVQMPNPLAQFVESALRRSDPSAWTWRVGLAGDQQDHVLVGPANTVHLAPPRLEGTGWSVNVLKAVEQTSILIRRVVANDAADSAP